MREKRVLVGRDKEDQKVIIKVSDSPLGRSEIRTEKQSQDTLTGAVFTSETLLFPEELAYIDNDHYTVRVTKFIDQEKVFAAYPVDEQFFLVLRAFEIMEAFHAATFEHLRALSGIPMHYARDYFISFRSFKENAEKYSSELGETMSRAEKLLLENKAMVDVHSDRLTHTDFAPANFRVKDHQVHLIDISSMLFGNKYEGLARFLNWAIIHSPELEKNLDQYVQTNYPSEYKSLHLMRIYKAGFLINHYVQSLSKTNGDLYKLTEIRIDLWHIILKTLCKNETIDGNVLKQYRDKRDSLRSSGEIKRQREFNLI